MATPVQAKERILFIDILRGLAMLAILVENMAIYSGRPYDLQALAEPIDRAIVVLIQFLFEAKSYSLFAFLFGWGMAVQMRLTVPVRRTCGGCLSSWSSACCTAP